MQNNNIQSYSCRPHIHLHNSNKDQHSAFKSLNTKHSREKSFSFFEGSEELYFVHRSAFNPLPHAGWGVRSLAFCRISRWQEAAEWMSLPSSPWVLRASTATNPGLKTEDPVSHETSKEPVSVCHNKTRLCYDDITDGWNGGRACTASSCFCLNLLRSDWV